MSAVSSGSPWGDAGVREPEASDEPRPAEAPDPGLNQADFGANEWLVEELYQRYLADPGSVDRAWWRVFADYQPARCKGPASRASPPSPGGFAGRSPGRRARSPEPSRAGRAARTGRAAKAGSG